MPWWGWCVLLLLVTPVLIVSYLEDRAELARLRSENAHLRDRIYRRR